MAINVTAMLLRAMGRGQLIIGGTSSITSTGAVTVTGATTIKTAITGASGSATTVGGAQDASAVTSYSGNTLNIVVIQLLTSTNQLDASARNIDWIVLAI
jgi:hypothetical protein